MTPMDFFTGTLAMGYGVCALFFARFWTRTRDGLFLAFAVCFFLLALGQVLTSLLNVPQEERTWIYLLRLVAFSILIVAILRKNFSR